MLRISRTRSSEGGFMSARRRAEAGFNLPELMIGLVIMGIMLSIAIPNFARMGRRDKVESVAYDFHRTLSMARQKALAKRTQYRVSMDTGTRTYFTERRENGAWVQDPPEVRSWCTDVGLTLDVGGSGSNADIIVGPQGTLLAEDSPARLTFTNAFGDTARVSFVRTGRIRVLL